MENEREPSRLPPREFTSEELEMFRRDFPTVPKRYPLDWPNAPLFVSQHPVHTQEYFRELVRACFQSRYLPRFVPKTWVANREGRPLADFEDHVSIYSCARGSECLNLEDISPQEMSHLSIFILPGLVTAYLRSGLQLELCDTAKRKSTSAEQIQEVESLLDRLIKLESATNENEGEEGCLYKLWFEGGLITAVWNQLVKATAAESTAGAMQATPTISIESDINNEERGFGSEARRRRQRSSNDASTTEITPTQVTRANYNRMQRLKAMERQDRLIERVLAAILGGLSLIAPMLIMAIHPSLGKTLITSSVATLIFALGLAWKSTAAVETLLGTTAAYAAVMVVFVGVSIP